MNASGIAPPEVPHDVIVSPPPVALSHPTVSGHGEVGGGGGVGEVVQKNFTSVVSSNPEMKERILGLEDTVFYCVVALFSGCVLVAGFKVFTVVSRTFFSATSAPPDEEMDCEEV